MIWLKEIHMLLTTGKGCVPSILLYFQAPVDQSPDVQIFELDAGAMRSSNPSHSS